jgi:integrase
VMRYCKTEVGWRRHPAAFGRNGRIRPGYVTVNGGQRHYPEGHYELRMYEGSKVVYKPVGDDPTEALNERDRQANLLVARDTAAAAGVQIVEQQGRALLQERRNAFLERTLARGKDEGEAAYRVAIDDFLAINRSLRYADEVRESHILDYYSGLRERGNSDRTIHNKHVSLFAFLKWCGLDTKPLAERSPNYTKKRVRIYSRADLQALFAACKKPYHRIVFQVLLMCGLRMQEAMFLEWPDLNFRAKKLHVQEKTDEGFRIKDRAERNVPLPDDLIADLQEWKTNRGDTRWVLGTMNDTPNWKLLQMLKRLASTSGLNCGKCASCKATGECEKWTLKRFRATYTTRLVRSGVDPRTVMEYTGHADLATVLMYLAADDDEEEPSHARVSAIEWF